MSSPAPQTRKTKAPPTDGRYTLKDLEGRKASELIVVANEFKIAGRQPDRVRILSRFRRNGLHRDGLWL